MPQSKHQQPQSLNPGRVDSPRLRITGLPAEGLLRLPQIVAPHGPIPVSRSTWWAGVRDGRFPQPVKLGRRTTAWRVADIRALIEEGPLDGRA